MPASQRNSPRFNTNAPRAAACAALAAIAALMAFIAAGGCERAPAPGAGKSGGGAVGRGADAGGQAMAGDAPPAERPLRLVALSPALGVMARDLGLGGFLVGRHAFDVWSDPALPSCGDQAGLDYEALIRARPSHVLVQWGQRELPARLNELAESQGWLVRDVPLLKLDDIPRAAEALWTLAGGRGAFAETPVSRRLSGAFAKRAGIRPERVGPVLLLYSAQPPTVLGPGSWHHQLLERLGGEPAVKSGGPYMTMDFEDVQRLAPGAIVLIAPRPAGTPAGERTPAALRTRLGRLAGIDAPAVKGDRWRVALIDDPLAAVPGTNLADLADELAKILEDWSR